MTTDLKPRKERAATGILRVEFDPKFIETVEEQLKEFKKKHGFILKADGFVFRLVQKHWEAEMKDLMDGKLKL